MSLEQKDYKEKLKEKKKVLKNCLQSIFEEKREKELTFMGPLA